MQIAIASHEIGRVSTGIRTASASDKFVREGIYDVDARNCRVIGHTRVVSIWDKTAGQVR